MTLTGTTSRGQAVARRRAAKLIADADFVEVRHQKGGIQRQRLIGIVYDLIAEGGFENFSLRQVANAAGVSIGTITYHFQSKRDLLMAALKSGYRLPSDWEQYRGSPVAQLRRIALSYAFASPNNRWWKFWINHLAVSTRDAEVQGHQHLRFTRQLAFWEKLVRDGIEAGELRPDVDAPRTVHFMMVHVHGLIVMQTLNPSPRYRSYARNEIMDMIDHLCLPVSQSHGHMSTKREPKKK